MAVEGGLAVAIILGIRVCFRRGDTYVRIYWMYRPEELPRGKERYHGAAELVASNHSMATCPTLPSAELISLVDIIPAKSVVGGAKVNHLVEGGGNPQNDPYWRQGFDIRTGELSVSADSVSCRASPLTL